MGQPVVHFEVNGRDGAALQRFFAQLFDWRIDANNPMAYGIVDTGSERGIQGGIGQTPDGQTSVTFYVEVDDPDAYLQRVEELGGKTLMPASEVPGGPVIAQFSTPEGHVIGLVAAQGG